MNKFVAIDFETAKDYHICAVGIVTVEDGEITDEYYSLIQPPYNEYSCFTIKVHGIRPEDTYDAPSFVEVYPEIKRRLANQIVVAHNESFDRGVLTKTMRDNKLDYTELNLSNRWECTMKKCRKLNRYSSGKLNECCAIDGIELNHHEALSDARGCAMLYLNVSE